MNHLLHCIQQNIDLTNLNYLGIENNTDPSNLVLLNQKDNDITNILYSIVGYNDYYKIKITNVDTSNGAFVICNLNIAC